MKKIILFLALISTPLLAQTVFWGTTPRDGIQATMSVSGDELRLGVSGAQWATVQFTCLNAGAAFYTPEFSNDGSVNFFASIFAKRISLVSANPTVQNPAGIPCNAGEIWELPLPANITHVRLREGAGTANTLQIRGGTPYVPGTPVTGIIYDTTSAVNTAIDTGTLDFSGWEFANVVYVTPAGGSGTISMVDDAGTSVAMFTVPASAGAWYPFAVSSPSATQVTALPATGSTGALPLQKRMRFQSAAVAALTSRIRIEVRR